MFSRLSSVVLFLVPLLFASACQEESSKAEARYIPDPYPDWDGPIHLAPFCQWTERPEPPREDLNVWGTHQCIPVPEGHDCGDYDLEEIDAILHQDIARECCGSIEGFLRGCYWSSHDGDGKPRCCYGAYYFSECTEPGVGQTCRQGESD